MEEKPITRERIAIAAAVIAVLLVASALLNIRYYYESGLGRCKSLVFESERSSCITSLAISERNSSLCRISGNPSVCYLQIAEKEVNGSMCAEAGSLKYECYSYMANYTKNPSFCSFLPNSSSCIIEIASFLGKPDLCVQVSNNSLYYDCLSASLIREAIDTNNVSLCNQNFSVPLSSALRYMENVSYKFESPLVDLIAYNSSNESFYNICTYFYATATSSPSLCSSIKSSLLKYSCDYFENVNITSNYTYFNYTSFLSECEKYSGSSSFCSGVAKLALGIESKNLSVCEGMEGVNLYSCYSAFAEAYKNASYCYYIQNSTYRGYCISNVNAT
ncbi:MAG: hypothetical protein QXL16_00105 [Candidatus Micrarchaeaceae archaeon]